MNQAQQPSQVLGVLIPGGGVRTDFLPTDNSGTKFSLVLSGISGADIASVSDLVFFLLPGVNLPIDHGAMLYWQIISAPDQTSMDSKPFSNQPSPTMTEFELVGAITNDRPSGSFRTGWATNETLSTAINSISSSITINLGVSIEHISNIKNVGAMNDNTTHVAKKIALNLFNFMSSFDDGSGGGGNIVVPKNVFDRWLSRFEAKARIDPNFFMKDQS